jgi:putative endonuclease
MPDRRRLFGNAGESVAERELVRRGMRVLARNARTRYGEIDLVCHDGSSFVFVEVKTRRTSSFVSAREAVDRLKLGRLARLAEAWLALHGVRSANWRLAVLALTVSEAGATAELLDVED